MMEYKRHEAFRLMFDTPIDAFSKFITHSDSREVTVKIVDISLNGAKILTNVDVHGAHEECKVELSFEINDSLLLIVGDITWKKPYANSHYYGMKFNIDDGAKARLLRELKLYAKNRVDEKKLASAKLVQKTLR